MLLGRISPGPIDAGVDDPDEARQAPIDLLDPVKVRLELDAAGAAALDEDEDDRQPTADVSPAQMATVARDGIETVDGSLEHRVRFEELRGRDVVGSPSGAARQDGTRGIVQSALGDPAGVEPADRPGDARARRDDDPGECSLKTTHLLLPSSVVEASARKATPHFAHPAEERGDELGSVAAAL